MEPQYACEYTGSGYAELLQVLCDGNSLSSTIQGAPLRGRYMKSWQDINPRKKERDEPVVCIKEVDAMVH